MTKIPAHVLGALLGAFDDVEAEAGLLMATDEQPADGGTNLLISADFPHGSTGFNVRFAPDLPMHVYPAIMIRADVAHRLNILAGRNPA